MSRLINFLNEMSVNDALRYFGISRDDFTIDLLKKRYREKSKLHHPDLGGDEEEMKRVTDAYSSLKNFKNDISKASDYKRVAKEYQELAKMVKDYLHTRFNPNNFIKYFSDLSGKDIIYTLTKEIPDKNVGNPSYAGFNTEFHTKERDIIFSFDVNVYLPGIKHSKSLGGGDEFSFNVNVNSFVFAYNKKHKIEQSTFKSTQNHKMLYEPKLTFPKNKVDKIVKGETSKRKFSKRDMITFLERKLGAQNIGKDSWKIPLGNDLYIILYRMVMMRIPTWGIQHKIYQKFKDVGTVSGVVTIYETEEAALRLEKLYKKINGLEDIRKIESHISDFIKKEKEINGY